MKFVDCQSVTGTAGAIWGIETDDLDATVVRWNEGKGVNLHTNNEVDVVMIVISGEGNAIVGNEQLHLHEGVMVIIPKTVERSIIATKGALTYINVHKRKKKLMPNMERAKI